MKPLTIFSLALLGCVLANCSSDDDNVPAIDATQNTTILTDFSTNVASTVYISLAGKTSTLYDNIVELTSTKSQTSLASAQATWKEAREIWEQSEAHLFGPVATEEIDPRIDTWPVNFTDLELQLSSENEFTDEYINNLDDALKGFHPIEYLIFGENGNKDASELTDRELEYLNALATNLRDLTAELATRWTPSTSGNYITEVSTAGNGSTTYKKQVDALEEIVNAMSGICDEVANGKLAEPYDQKDPQLEESPFAGNSIIDFTNNIKGVKNVYTGSFASDGHGLDELVKKHNLSLDAEITASIDAAINALGKITDPFGEAITTQSVQIENAMDAINELQTVLNEKLLPFVQQHAN